MTIKLTPGETNVMFLTGAGISAGSGIRPFRGAGGWWTDDPEAERRAAAPDLPAHPDRIWEIYGPLRPIMARAQPNAAHLALARLQKESGCDVRLVTQNVDGLHQKAGFQDVIELHGSLLRTRCSRCDLPPFDDPEGGARPCPRCDALLRPDVVLFGEQIPHPADLASFAAVLRCDVFVAVGTSGSVWPASSLVQRAHTYGAETVIVNLEPLQPANPAFLHELLGKAEDILPGLFAW